MIDTDKYEGHTEGLLWPPSGELAEWARADRQLIADAPLLLAEVKRLREKNDELHAQRVQFSWIQESRTGRSSRYVGEEE